MLFATEEIEGLRVRQAGGVSISVGRKHVPGAALAVHSG